MLISRGLVAQQSLANKLRNMKILIVDDQEVYRKTLRILLQQKESIPYIEEAGNGLECLQLLSQNSFDVILMDIQMPQMDGIEATKIIVQKHPENKILAMSMYATKNDVIALRNAGARGFVEKGLAFGDLIKIMEKVYRGEKHFEQLEPIKKG